MGAVQQLRESIQAYGVDDAITARIFAGYENITDGATKRVRAAFFLQAISVMDEMLPEEARRDIRDACACSTGGWRLKASQKIGKEYKGRPIEEALQALGEVRYMGKPVLNPDGTITAGIGDEGGFDCPCPVFTNVKLDGPVSKTYCYCCAGHYRFHYQIALNRKLVTKTVISSILNSAKKEPCRFVYEIVDEGAV